MRLTTMVLVSSAALCGVATAQPVDNGGTTDVNPTPNPTPTPTPTPTPEPTPTPQPQPMHEHMMPEMHDARPSEVAFAIGLGYIRPTGGSIDLQTPNIASVRLRLTSGLTFEPVVRIANASTDNDNGTTQTTDTTTEFEVGTLARLTIIKHGNVDFEILASLGFDVTKDNPDGDYNTKTTTSLNVGWGLGIGYWITHHWQLSASAVNPLVGYSQSKQETSQTTSTKTTTTSFGVVFDPAIFVMVHLYN